MMSIDNDLVLDLAELDAEDEEHGDVDIGSPLPSDDVVLTVAELVTAKVDQLNDTITNGVMSIATVMENTVQPDTSELENETRSVHLIARDGDVDVMRMFLNQMKTRFFEHTTSTALKMRKFLHKLDADDLSPLHYAARYGHIDMVDLLIEYGSSVNVKGMEKTTPLHFAARYRKVTTKSDTPRMSARSDRILVDVGSSPKTERESSVVIVPYGGDGDFEDSMVHCLLEHGADINSKDQYGLTPLHYAAMRGNEPAAYDLVEDPQIDINALDNQNMTPLHMAATYGYFKIVKLLVGTGADINCRDESLQGPLHKSALEGHLDIIKYIIGMTKMEGGEKSVFEILRMLDDESNSPLHLAIEHGDYEIVQCLVEAGSDVNGAKSNGSTPLHSAAISGDVKIVQEILNAKARVNALNKNQETALHKAAQYNNVDIIDLLIDNGAVLQKRDKDGYTPLLETANEGHCEAMVSLIHHGADVCALDKDDKSAIYLAAENNNVDVLQILLNNKKAVKTIDDSDRYNESPLHVASEKGYVRIVKMLLNHGSQVDNKNDDGQTALHIAAKKGNLKVVNELMKWKKKKIVNDEDESGHTPLHLAASEGQDIVVNKLLDAGAVVDPRNVYLWTPLDSAACKGWLRTCRILLKADCPVDPMDRSKTTPLHLAAKHGHAHLVGELLKFGADVCQKDNTGYNVLETAIVHNHPMVALEIINSPGWRMALSSSTSKNNGYRNSPLRMLIKKFPEVAEAVFDRCTNISEHTVDDKNLSITFKYDYIDDAFAEFMKEEDGEDEDDDEQANEEQGNATNQKGGASLQPYTTDNIVLKNNHPMMVMVHCKRQELLAHPLCNSLILYKWHHFGRYVYYGNLLFFVIFLLFLTGYILVTPAPERPPASVLMELTSNGTNTTEPDIEETCSQNGCEKPHQQLFATVSKYAIMVMAIINLIRECFQMIQAMTRNKKRRWNYIGLENFIEWTCFITALLLVVDITDEAAETGRREAWQWQVGAVSIFMGWLVLVMFIKKFPFFGIFVVMFTDVLRTFCQFFVVFFLFIVAFGLTFYTLLQNHMVEFHSPGDSLLKTFVMMIGEFDYGTIFYNEEHELTYKILTYIIFLVFVVIMPIIIMNLLVGLAVDDIKVVQDQAVLKRLAMQVQLVLEVETLIPDFIRRRFYCRKWKLYPNKPLGWTSYIFREKAIFLQVLKDTLFGNEKLDQEAADREKQKMSDDIHSLKRSVRGLHNQNRELLSLVKRLAATDEERAAMEEEDDDNEEDL